MKTLNSIAIRKEYLQEIIKLSPEREFLIFSPLFYEGQIPVVAFLITNGSIQLFKKKILKKKLETGYLIGLKELMTNSPSSLTAFAEAQSTICFLDKSTILEIINGKNNCLASIFKGDSK